MSNLNELYPARNFAMVTPNDSVDLVSRCRAIIITVAGDIALHDEDGNTVVLSGWAVGVPIPVSTKRILSTNTTATGISIYY